VQVGLRKIKTKDHSALLPKMRGVKMAISSIPRMSTLFCMIFADKIMLTDDEFKKIRKKEAA